MKYLLFAVALIYANCLSAYAAPASEPDEPINSAHMGYLTMDFLSGRWVGQLDSLKVEETWTPASNGQWFGIKKIDDGGNIEYQIFTFRYSNMYLSGEVRKLTEDLSEPANKTSKFTVRINSYNKRGTATIPFSDGSSISYVSMSPTTAILTLTDKNSIQKIELKKQ